MPRQSTRLKDAPPHAIADDVSDGEEDVPLALLNRATKPPRARKRKATEEPEASSATAQHVAKKVRGKRGMLKELVEMPMDVLFEIFSQLDPLDLLHLARTTKDLRAILMSRSSISIWKQAFASIPALPECPDDMTEPQYADLAFGKNCYYCQRNLASNHTCWAARVRTCTKCLEQHFNYEKYYRYRPYTEQLAMLLPSISLTVRSGRASKTKIYVHRETDTTWLTEFRNLNTPETKTAWLKIKVSEAQAKDNHDIACTLWAKKQQELRDSQKASAIDERRAIIVDRTKQLWGDELAKMPKGRANLEDLPVVAKACQKDLTERVLQNLETPINEFMEEVRGRRLIRDRENFLKERMVTLKKTYIQYLATLPPQVFYPNTAEIFVDEVVQDIVNNSATPELTDEQLDLVTDRFPYILKHWKEHIEQQLLEYMFASDEAKQSPEKSDKEAVLGLATTFFFCSSCRDYLPTKMTIEHTCARSTGYGDKTGTPEVEAVNKAIQEVPWNYANYISFKGDNAMKAMPRALKMCGFDPATITAEDLDQLDPIIECLTCNHAYQGRNTMKWFSMCNHISKCHGPASQFQMLVLDEDEAAKVRDRMEESRQRNMVREYTEFCICAHCRQKGNGVLLMRHVHQEHGIEMPVLNEDVVEIPGSRKFDDVITFKMWPPRLQANVDAMQVPP